MIRLSTLGSTDLRTASGKDLRSVLAQPKRLGLLIYLAVEAPDRFVRRDTLLALFWPELDQAQARQALRSALYFLRQRVGDNVVTSRGADEVGTSTADLSCDVIALRQAAERDDPESALSLYHGDFLAGLHIPDSSAELDQWLSNTRLELRRSAAQLGWRLAERSERGGNADRAVQWALRARDIEGDDEASLRRLVALLNRAGDPGKAIRAYEEFEARLEADLGVPPSPETRQLVDRLRAARAPGNGTLHGNRTTALDRDGDAMADPTAAQPPPTSPANRRTSRRKLAMVGSLIVATVVSAMVVSRRPTSTERIPLTGPVVVAAFKNETGDSSLAILGRYAGDWITQGLESVARLPVVPWTTALRASRFADSSARASNSDPVSVLRRETGAGTVVTGSYYKVNDTLRFRAEVSDSRTGRLIWSLPVIAATPDSVEVAIGELRDRLMGGIGVASDKRYANDARFGRQPPRFAAFTAYDKALGLLHQSNYDDAAVEYERAFALDSSFLTSALGATTAYWNQAKYAKADSLVRLLTLRRGSMTEYQDLQLTWFQARLRGDGRVALETQRRLSAVAPNSAATYNLAMLSIHMNRPHEALSALEGMDSSAVTVNAFPPYWMYRAHANHMVGRHEAELDAVRELRRRFPDRSVGLVLTVCALAALDRTAAIDSVLAADASAPNTYWSAGAALVSAGEELVAHGHADHAPPYFARAVTWLETQLRTDPRNRYFREWLGTAFYQTGRWDDAGRIADGLMADFPDRRVYRRMAAVVAARRGDTAAAERLLGEPPIQDLGLHLAARARIAAIAGDADRAASLFAEALDRGISEFQWDHADWLRDFEKVRSDPRIKRLLFDGLDQEGGRAR